MQYSLICLKLL
jgi:thiamine kinase-like enzyme